jgi:hypothetical protein
MNGIDFWKNWPFPYKATYLVLAFLGLALCLLMPTLHQIGHDLYIHWYEQVTPELVTIPAKSIDIGVGEAVLPSQFIVNTTKFTISEYEQNTLYHYGFAVLFIIGFAVILTVISEFNLVPYLIGLSIVTFTLVSANWEAHGILTSIHPKTLLVLLLLAFTGSTFLFRSFATHVTAWKRLAYYLLLFAIVGYLVFTFSNQEKPALYAFYKVQAVSTIYYALLIIIVSFEIPRGIFWLFASEKGIGISKSFLNICILTVLYFGNFLYIYLYDYRTTDLEIFHIGTYFIVALSIIIGFVGWGHRENEYKQLFNFIPTGAYLYTGLVLTGIAVWGTGYSSGNTALISVYDKGTIYLMVAFGLFYNLYLLNGYADDFLEDKPVYKKIYTQSKLDIPTIYLAGTIAFAVFIWSDDFVQYKKLISGHFTYSADYQDHIENEDLAIQLYAIAGTYGRTNTKAYIRRAQLLNEKGAYMEGLSIMNQAAVSNADPFVYVYAANLSTSTINNNIFEGIFRLENGLGMVREKGYLLNNLALLYNKTNLKDSVIINFQRASGYKEVLDEVRANQMALLAKYNLQAEYTFNAEGDNKEITNALAYLMYSGAVDQVKPKALDLNDPQVLHNFSWFNPEAVPDSLLNPRTKEFQNLDNPFYLAFAHNLFESSDYLNAFRLSDYLVSNDDGSMMRPWYFGLRYIELGRLKEGLKLLQAANFRGDNDLNPIIEKVNLFLGAIQTVELAEQTFEACKSNNGCSEKEVRFIRNRLLKADPLSHNVPEIKRLMNWVFTAEPQIIQSTMYLGPYDEIGVLSKVSKLYVEGGIEKAYQYIAEVSQVNEDSPFIRELYIRMAAEYGLDNYALQALYSLEGVVSTDRYNQLQNLIESYKDEDLEW